VGAFKGVVDSYAVKLCARNGNRVLELDASYPIQIIHSNPPFVRFPKGTRNCMFRARLTNYVPILMMPYLVAYSFISAFDGIGVTNSPSIFFDPVR